MKPTTLHSSHTLDTGLSIKSMLFAFYINKIKIIILHPGNVNEWYLAISKSRK